MRRIVINPKVIFCLILEPNTAHHILFAPAYEISEPATSELITNYIPLLQNLESDSFAIIDTAMAHTCKQNFENGKYEVEHQLVSLASHYLRK